MVRGPANSNREEDVMTQSNKRGENTAAPTRGAAAKATPKAGPSPTRLPTPLPAKASPTPAGLSSAASTSGRKTTFEGTLLYVMGLADAVSLEQSPSAPDAAATAPPAAELLAKALTELGPEVAVKLRTLMVAGRDGRGVTAVHVDTKPADGDSGAAAADLSANGPLLGDYLRRGHAMACATGFDLEKNIVAWPSSAPHTLDERAWLSFGVQLAKSQPEEWTCLGFVGADARQLTKLYLRLGEHAWWSFRALLDRPSAAVVDKEKRVLSKARSKGLSTDSLKPMADRSCGTEGRALRRAVKAIRARVGVAVEPA